MCILQDNILYIPTYIAHFIGVILPLFWGYIAHFFLQIVDFNLIFHSKR